MIELGKINKKKIYYEIEKPVIYNAEKYGIKDQTGKNVKISILDTGCPSHKDILINSEAVSFCENTSTVQDKIGHSTIVSGIIGANNKKSIVGVSPHATILFGKVFNDRGECNFNSIVAGVLWSIVKDVDIIVMAFGTKYDYGILKDAIKKAVERGICVFAASGNMEMNEVDYPANYENVFSSGYLFREKNKNRSIKEKVKFYLPNKPLMTTYLENKYIESGGSSIATSYFAGISALFIEKFKKENVKKEEIPALILNKLKGHIKNNG